MASQNQGGSSPATHTVAYDNPSYVTRVSSSVTIAAGGSATSTKFYAWTQLTIWGFTLITTTQGTSTYTVNGTATTSAETVYVTYVANTNTTGTAIALATTTVGAATGPFVAGGTAAIGTNVSVPGLCGGLLGGYTGPYAFNTLGGTNTSMAWGTQTFTNAVPGGGIVGWGGLPMNPGDYIAFVSGTDATWAGTVYIQYSIQAPNGVIAA